MHGGEANILIRPSESNISQTVGMMGMNIGMVDLVLHFAVSSNFCTWSSILKAT
jgi:hypothetical protein